MSKSKSRFSGPAMLVAAAFIGPGTVLTASKAGAKYGFSLLWVVVFASLAAIVLQEMAARIGIATGSGLAQAIKRSVANPILRWIVLVGITLGIFFGNGAFETGNLLGASAGIEILAAGNAKPVSVAPKAAENGNPADTSKSNPVVTSPATPKGIDLRVLVSIALFSAMMILTGKFDWLQHFLTALVVVMSIAFVLAAVLSMPSLQGLALGMIPKVPKGSALVIVGLIGTTIVPYNFFLHSSAAANRWPAEKNRKTADKDRAVSESASNTRFAIAVGGAITAAILITAATAFHSSGASGGTPIEPKSIRELVPQLEPVLGIWASWLFGLGLFAAGLSSSLTAPIAAAWLAAGCFGWPNQLSDWRLKFVAMIVLLTGFGFAYAYGASPQDAILLAQAANGLLLPLIAVLLIFVANRLDIMLRYRNSVTQNVLGGIAILVVSLFAFDQLRQGLVKLFFSSQ